MKTYMVFHLEKQSWKLPWTWFQGEEQNSWLTSS